MNLTRLSKPFSFLLLIALALSFSIAPARAEGFTSTPVLFATPDELYNYTVTMDTNWNNLSMTTTADWLVVSNGTNVSGIPSTDDVGVYLVNLTLTNDTATAYQNYTLVVEPLEPSNLPSNQYLLLALIFGFGLIGMGLLDRRWNFLAGIVWIYLALAVFGVFGIPWLIIGVAFGMILLVDGAMNLLEGG